MTGPHLTPDPDGGSQLAIFSDADTVEAFTGAAYGTDGLGYYNPTGWEIFSAMDGAIFYDAGKVASRAEDLTLDDLESDYGIGFRFGTANGVFLRVEGAFGSSGGKHFILRFGNVF